MRLGLPWGRLGGVVGRLGGFLDRLVAVSWASWGVLGHFVLDFHAKTWLDLGMPV